MWKDVNMAISSGLNLHFFQTHELKKKRIIRVERIRKKRMEWAWIEDGRREGGRQRGRGNSEIKDRQEEEEEDKRRREVRDKGRWT